MSSQLSQTPTCAANVPQVIIVDSNEKNSLLGKRPADSPAQNSLVNKFIITKNTSQSFPIQVQSISAGHSTNLQSGASVTVVNPGTNPLTSSRTITISPQGFVSPVKGNNMAQVVEMSPKLPVTRLPFSPAKSPTKITMIPVPGRSPQKIAPANLGNSIVNNPNTTQATLTMSPSKVIKQPGTVHVIQKAIQPSLSGATVMTIPRQGTVATTTGVRQVTLPTNVQQIHVPGNKFHYIRLANPPTSTGTRAQILPVTAGAGTQQPVKISIPAQQTQLVTTRPSGGTSVQRIILPAAPSQQVTIRPAPGTSLAPGGTAQVIRTTLTAGTSGLQQLSSAAGGTTFLSTGSAGPQGMPGFALVPASYLSQIQQQIQAKPAVPATVTTTVTTTVSSTSQARTSSDFVHIAPNNPVATTQKNVNGSSLEGAARQRKPCNCTKSQCLKLYCDCFANGEFCHNCNCTNCANNLDHEEDRSRAIKQCLERNPLAFHPKIGKGKAGEKDRRHNKGCNCKRSGCLKNYCECYEAKIMCSSSCKCVGCKNFEESPERKTLMHLADAAEVRVQQQTAAKSKLSSQISDLPSRPVSSVTGERLPFSFVTQDVVEATCACLMAQAEEAERQVMPPVVQERMVIEEFGRCLMQIIESANRTKAPDPDDTG